MGNNKLLRFALWMAVGLILPKAAWTQPKSAQVNNTSCSSNALPPEFQKRLISEFASWKIQEVSDLSASAQARWLSAEYQGCPGIAVGEFRESNRRSYAVLLVPRERPDSAYRLVIYSPGSDSASEEFFVVEKGDAAGASNFFLHAARTDELFDAPFRRKFHISTKDAFLFFDSGEKEYEVDAYYWSDGAYRSAFVDM